MSEERRSPYEPPGGTGGQGSGASPPPPPPPPGGGGWSGTPSGAFPGRPPRRKVGRKLALGALLGVVALIGLPLLMVALDNALNTGGALLGVGLLLLLALGIVLVVIERTRLLGAGVFIGYGVALVVGAGVCVALLAAPVRGLV